MQNFVVVELITQDNGRIAAPVNAFDTQELAESKYYSVLAQAVKSSYLVHSAILMTAEGFVLDTKCFKHTPIPQPEPEPEPEQE